MNTATDHTSHIGEQHRRTGKPNQDYVLSGNLENGLAYAIVSDGCSSGGMTDIGSRLMVLATKRAIERYAKSDNWLQESNAVMEVNLLRDIYLEVYRESLGLKYEDLLATCLWAISDKSSVLINLTGDGVVCIQYESGTRQYQFVWDQNIPYYPAYKIGGLDNQFRSAYVGSATPLILTENVAREDNESVITLHAVEIGMKGWSLLLDNEVDTELGKIVSVALFTDGVEQVEGFTHTEVVDQLMAFKSASGQFAVRRMNRFLKEAASTSKGPMDDISYAVIHISQTET